MPVTGEEELLATRMLLDVPTAGMSVEEQMVIASGMYGSGAVGGYGGLVTDDTTVDIDSSPVDSGLFESAQQSSSTSSPAAPATTTKSSASSAQFSLVAGAVAAAAVLLL